MRTGKPAHRATLPFPTPHIHTTLHAPVTHNPQHSECPLFVLLVENCVLDFKICITKLQAAVLSISAMLMNSTFADTNKAGPVQGGLSHVLRH